MQTKAICSKGTKIKSKRPQSSDNEKEVSKEALEKLNKLSQNFIASFGLDLQSVIPKEISSEKELQNTVESQDESSHKISTDDKVESKPKEPEVIVFNLATSNSSNSKAQYRKFMSSKIKALDETPKALSNPKKHDIKDEDNIKRDVELNDLLKNSRLIEELAASELTGKDRRKHQYQQLVKLGCKPSKAHHNPKNVRLEMIGHKKRKIEESIAKAKEEGIYHKSIKHVFEKDMPKKKARKNDGLKTSMGRFHDGVLHISKAHIKRNAVAVKTTTKGSKNGFHRK